MEDKKEDKTSSAVDDKSTDKGQSKADVNSDLSAEQWELAFKHPRFKELTERAKELDKLRKEIEKQEETKLKEKEEFKTLADKYQAENEMLKKQIVNQAKKQALLSQAVALGVRKEALDDVIRLVDLESIQVDESGNVTNADSVLKQLVESKSYLLAEGQKKNIGTSNISDSGSKSQFWKWSDIEKKSKDHSWYMANKDEIEKAKTEGRINYTE